MRSASTFIKGTKKSEHHVKAERGALAGRSLAIQCPDLSGGGMERLQLDIAPYFLAAGLKVTLLLGEARGALLSQVPAGVEVVSLDCPRQLASLPPLARYLRRARPDILLANTEHPTILALWARWLARSPTRIIACQHNAFSAQALRAPWQFRALPALYRMFIGAADRIVAVSGGVADDLAQRAHLERGRIEVIYNGVVDDAFDQRSLAPAEHPWFQSPVPVIVGAGRLVGQKDFATLIKAFAEVARERPVRLALLGEGPMRETLLELARSLGVEDRVALLGFRPNPLPYLRGAAVVALTSRNEGFGMVLAEALACGTPVVSTDCPHGPAEILDDGRYGRLVPVGDVAALSGALRATLDQPLPRETLRQRGQSFTISTSAERYLDLFEDVLAPSNGIGAARRSPAAI
jgi:glycosyltransferase involved in cell wall biosynthesis